MLGSSPVAARGPVRILIVGGGQAGLFVALGLKRLRRDEAEVTLVNPESYMTYQSFLAEAAGGNIEPRHVVIPLRTVVRKVRLLTGEVVTVDHDRRTAAVRPNEGIVHEVAYDILILALGSVSRALDIPGLAEQAVGFKTVEEAIFLRNKVIDRMDLAESTTDPDLRRRALSFVFVGGGYAGVEAMAELEDLARAASRYYPTVKREDMRWVLVEAAPFILPEIDRSLGAYATALLRKRGVEIFLETRLVSAEGSTIALSNGERFEADTLVWTAGVRAHPLAASFGIPLDERGRMLTDEFLRVKGMDGVWAAGDSAAITDPATGAVYPPTAQHALREARRLAKNVVATMRGGAPVAFRYRALGTIASLGRYKGVARVLGVRLRGFPAWFTHRSYHLLRIPTFNRKVRIMMDWTVGLFFPRDVTQLGSLQHPRQPFEDAAGDPGGRPGV